MTRHSVLALALVAGLSAPIPALAVEVLIEAPTLAAMQAAAAAIGYATKDAQGKWQITQTGLVVTGGSYFVNHVGKPTVPTGNMTTCTGPGGGSYACPEMQTLTNEFIRVRHNADPAAMPNPPAALLQQYNIKLWRRTPLGPNDANGNPTLCWSSDGTTCGPAYLDLIGVIS